MGVWLRTGPVFGAGLAGPVAVILVAVAVVVVAVVSPEEPGHYPLCPFRQLTGLACPGCGGLRAVHALVHGDVATAVHRNALLVVLLPFAVIAWVRWTRSRRRGGTAIWYPSVAVSRALLASFVVFGVLRNLPLFAFLAP